MGVRYTVLTKILHVPLFVERNERSVVPLAFCAFIFERLILLYLQSMN